MYVSIALQEKQRQEQLTLPDRPFAGSAPAPEEIRPRYPSLRYFAELLRTSLPIVGQRAQTPSGFGEAFWRLLRLEDLWARVC